MHKTKKPYSLVLKILAGGVCAAALSTGAASAQDVPQIITIPTQGHPPIPAGLKVTCTPNPNTGAMSATCPVILYKGVTTWAYSYIDNRVSYGLVSYAPPESVVRNVEAPGARYVYKMTVNPQAQTVSIWGQSNAKVDVKWADLPSVPPGPPKYAWYVASTPPHNTVIAPASPHQPICKGLDAKGGLWAGWWNGTACVGSLNAQAQITHGNFQFLIRLAGAPAWPAFTGAPPADAINAGKNPKGQDQYLCSQNGYIGWINGKTCDFSGAAQPASPAVALQGLMD